MKKEDNITELYKNAFNDYSVRAPASVYKKVQLELDRKSLLTIDPTRLNVFYMALMSGAVAWAILGNYSAEITNASIIPEIKANTELVLQHNSIQDNKYNSANEFFEELEKAEVVQPVIFEKSWTRQSITNATDEIIFPNELVGELEGLEEIISGEQIEFVENVEISSETIEDNAKAEEKEEDFREKISLTNSRVESASEFMRLLSLDSDKKGALTISTKKK
tara:strand:- start:10579 stop:11244 length:666 start_codon:yes stop_codon:yes gene_type:complete